MYFFILLLTVASENHFWILIDCEINLMGNIKIIYNQMASREISVLFLQDGFLFLISFVKLVCFVI